MQSYTPYTHRESSIVDPWHIEFKDPSIGDGHEQRLYKHIAALIEEDEDNDPLDSVICPVYLIRCLVGRNGQTLKYLQEQTNTQISIQDASLHDMRRVVIEGSRTAQIDKAKRMVYGLLAVGCSEMTFSHRHHDQVQSFLPKRSQFSSSLGLRVF